MTDQDRVDDLAERTYALLSAGDREGARALFQELEGMAPEGRETLMVKAALLSEDDPDGALAVIDEVYARWPDDPAVLLSRASYLLELLEDAEEALPLVEEAVATLEEAVGDDEAGRAFLAEAAVLLADCRLSAGDAVGAAEAAELALAKDPSYVIARLVLAAARFALCDLDAAARELEAVLAADRTLADAHHLLGRVAQARGKRDEAARHFEEAHGLARDRHPIPYRVDGAKFLELLARARELLPPEVKEALEDLPLRIEARPDLEELSAQEEPVPPDVPCLVEVSELEEQEGDEETQYSLDGVVLFQENLELLAADEEELVDIIADALTEEMVGALGLDDDEADEDATAPPADA